MQRIIALLISIVWFLTCEASEVMGKTDLNAILQRIYTESSIPGMSVSIVQDNKTDNYVFGYTNCSDSKKIDLHTQFQAGSISKVFAALAIILLNEEKKINLHEDIRPYIDKIDFDVNEKITVAQLVSMTAGLNVESFQGYEQDVPLPSLREIISGHAPANNTRVELVAKPGSKYLYSGGGYTILELLIETLSGQTYINFVKENILEKVDMNDTTFLMQKNSEINNIACGTDANDNKIASGWKLYPQLAAAGIWTTPNDLANLATNIIASYKNSPHGLFSSTSINHILKRQINSTYGLGFHISECEHALCIDKAGATEGYRSIMLVYPELGNAIIVMTNSSKGTAVFKNVLRAVEDYYNWPVAHSLDPVS